MSTDRPATPPSDGAPSTAATPVEPIMPDPPPLGRTAVLRQRWEELAYLHWPYPPDEVQRILPPGLRVDTFDDRGWVGLIPFEMRGVRLGPSPVVPWLGRFIEINVRTYVVDPLGRRGVWFCSLDVPRAPIVAVARSVFSLPYCWADASHDVVTPTAHAADRAGEGTVHRYRMRRRRPHSTAGATADIRFTVGRRLADDEVEPFDHWSSARWALLTTRRGELRYGRVHHPRWPLHELHDVALSEDVVAAAGLPRPDGEPHARYSPGVPVTVGWFEPGGDR